MDVFTGLFFNLGTNYNLLLILISLARKNY
jgi:hypothetical protein